MLFQLPIDADTSVLNNEVYVDELKRVSQTDLEQWMFLGNSDIGALKNTKCIYTFWVVSRHAIKMDS